MQLAHNLSSLANLLDIIVVIHVTSRILISNSSVESQHPKGYATTNQESSKIRATHNIEPGTMKRKSREINLQTLDVL